MHTQQHLDVIYIHPSPSLQIHLRPKKWILSFSNPACTVSNFCFKTCVYIKVFSGLYDSKILFCKNGNQCNLCEIIHAFLFILSPSSICYPDFFDTKTLVLYKLITIGIKINITYCKRVFGLMHCWVVVLSAPLVSVLSGMEMVSFCANLFWRATVAAFIFLSATCLTILRFLLLCDVRINWKANKDLMRNWL